MVLYKHRIFVRIIYEAAMESAYIQITVYANVCRHSPTDFYLTIGFYSVFYFPLCSLKAY